MREAKNIESGIITIGPIDSRTNPATMPVYVCKSGDLLVFFFVPHSVCPSLCMITAHTLAVWFGTNTATPTNAFQLCWLFYQTSYLHLVP